MTVIRKLLRIFTQPFKINFINAITGQTAAEIVHNSADRTKEHMGLNTWKNAPDGRILKSDVVIAKNYLDEKQIKQLERAITGYFDYIEDLVERENTFTMAEFTASVNEFLSFRRYKILKDSGFVPQSPLTADGVTFINAFPDSSFDFLHKFS